MAIDINGALGHSTPAANTPTDIYTVPTSRRATVTVLVCNRNASATSIRISHAKAGAADNLVQYLAYDLALAANSTIATVNFTMAAGDVLRVRSASGFVTFNVNGIEEDA